MGVQLSRVKVSQILFFILAKNCLPVYVQWSSLKSVELSWLFVSLNSEFSSIWMSEGINTILNANWIV